MPLQGAEDLGSCWALTSQECMFTKPFPSSPLPQEKNPESSSPVSTCSPLPLHFLPPSLTHARETPATPQWAMLLSRQAFALATPSAWTLPTWLPPSLRSLPQALSQTALPIPLPGPSTCRFIFLLPSTPAIYPLQVHCLPSLECQPQFTAISMAP